MIALGQFISLINYFIKIFLHIHTYFNERTVYTELLYTSYNIIYIVLYNESFSDAFLSSVAILGISLAR